MWNWGNREITFTMKNVELSNSLTKQIMSIEDDKNEISKVLHNQNNEELHNLKKQFEFDRQMENAYPELKTYVTGMVLELIDKEIENRCGK